VNSSKFGRIVGILLFIGVLNMPYGYYRLLRIVVTISSAVYSFHFLEENKMNMVYLFGFIAILFNPIIPIYFDKQTWMVIDIVVGGLFLYFNPDKLNW